uniref:Uncharacterized protein n=1 Tax=Globodera rostochiensis TaxID=31243 RepID=A0A914I7Q5_GLORO
MSLIIGGGIHRFALFRRTYEERGGGWKRLMPAFSRLVPQIRHNIMCRPRVRPPRCMWRPCAGDVGQVPLVSESGQRVVRGAGVQRK